MSDTPIKIEVNCETGIAVEVPLTAAEIAQRELDAACAPESPRERSTTRWTKQKNLLFEGAARRDA